MTTQTRNHRKWLIAAAAVLLAACGGGDDTCDPADAEACKDGLVCEAVEGGDPGCFAPVVIRGEVFDLADEAAVEGAHVVALDVNGAALSEVAISDETGAYELSLPSTRSADGVPIGIELTLRADADAYQTFPAGLRQALPLDTSVAAQEEDTWVVASALSDIGLIALPSDAGSAQIFGTVELPAAETGVLVVATGAGGQGYAAIANRSGGYRIFNVPAGDYDVVAYARGVNYDPAQASVEAAGSSETDLVLSDEATGTVSGTVQIVNAPGGATTSVILAIESTFNESLARGQTVPGLRVPEPGVVPDVTGEYVFEGVPAGRYVVLAAFENDALVRDPDLSIGGTSILHIEVTPGATTTVDGFKVTEALEVFGPGAASAEAVTGAPTFSWADDSSEDQYVIEVFDAFGEVVWEQTIDGVSGRDPLLDYAGPALEAGMYYQYRVTSMKDSVPISRTEDLVGVFFVP